MNTTIRNLLIVLLLAVAVLATYILLPSSRQPMPEISFTDIDGKPHQLTDYKGQPVLMIFWATDCPGCIKEMPELIAVHEAYADKGLAMIGVAMPHDNPEHIQAMRRQKGLPYTLTWDEHGDISAAFDNVRVTPTHFLISPEGEIVMRKIGELSQEQLEQALASMGFAPEHT
ncbi:MAG: TlpA disulfide reductase family protein [Methylophaga sp.]|jgi:peroxiredoxin